MKKYKTTSKHPCYKEGLTVKSSYDNIWIEDNGLDCDYDFPIIMALEKGWVEEIQEPQFTIDDLHELMEFISCESPIGLVYNSLDYHLRMLKLWLKQRDKDKKKDK